MNESIFINFTGGPDILNATGFIIDSNPFQGTELLLYSILGVSLISLFLTLWFSRRHLKQ